MDPVTQVPTITKAACLKAIVEYFFSPSFLDTNPQFMGLIVKKDSAFHIPIEAVMSQQLILAYNPTVDEVCDAISDSKLVSADKSAGIVKTLFNPERIVISIVADGLTESDCAEYAEKNCISDLVASITKTSWGSIEVALKDDGMLKDVMTVLETAPLNGKIASTSVRKEKVTPETTDSLTMAQILFAYQQMVYTSAMMYGTGFSSYGAETEGYSRGGSGHAREGRERRERSYRSDRGDRSDRSRGHRSYEDKKPQYDRKPARKPAVPVVDSSSFPPLTQPIVTTEVSSGYATKFHKYTAEQILGIVKMIPKDQLEMRPACCDTVPELFNDAPSFLTRQRSDSMDAVAKALADKRKPIRSESIDSVDFESMLSGESEGMEERRKQKKKHNYASVIRKPHAETSELFGNAAKNRQIAPTEKKARFEAPKKAESVVEPKAPGASNEMRSSQAPVHHSVKKSNKPSFAAILKADVDAVKPASVPEVTHEAAPALPAPEDDMPPKPVMPRGNPRKGKDSGWVSVKSNKKAGKKPQRKDKKDDSKDGSW